MWANARVLRVLAHKKSTTKIIPPFNDLQLTQLITMPKLCCLCNANRAVLKRPKTGQQICKTCFYEVFETEIHHTIVDNKLFNRGDRVAIGASGGKDSTVLAHVMTTLNERYDYGLDLFLLSVDEGITGYRDDSLEVSCILHQSLLL